MAANASPTGPMFPRGVESKVEQYLKTNCRHPCSFSQLKAWSDCRIASGASIDRVLRATIPASHPCGMCSADRPKNCIVASPPFARVLAISLAPVKSSAITPRYMCVSFGKPWSAGSTGYSCVPSHPRLPHEIGAQLHWRGSEEAFVHELQARRDTRPERHVPD